MYKTYRRLVICAMLVVPVLCLVSLLVLTQRSAAFDPAALDPAALDTAALNSAVLEAVLSERDEALQVQTLRPQKQGTVVLPVGEGDVVITKTADVNSARVGSTVQYDVVVENKADITVTTVVVDQIPDELRLRRVLTGTALLPPPSTDAFTASVEIAPMDAVTLTYEVLVRSLPAEGSLVTNTAIAEVSVGVPITEGTFIISDSTSISVTQSLIPLPIIRTAPLDLIENGRFENGSDGSWTEVGTRGTLIVDESQLPDSITPRSGSSVAWLGGFATDTSVLLQNINVPQGYSQIYLQYYYWLDSTDGSCGDDLYAAGGYLADGTGAATNASDFLCTPTNTDGWTLGCVDLAPLGGRSVDVAFITLSSENGESSLFVDDVSIEESCPATPEAG